MLDGFEAEVAVACASGGWVIGGCVVAVSGVCAAVGSVEEGELAQGVGADVADEGGATVDEAVCPLAVKFGGDGLAIGVGGGVRAVEGIEVGV